MQKREKRKANWSDPATTAENEVLPGWMKWAWVGRGIGYSLNVVLILQLTYYCTDLLGMPTALVGSLLLASKVFDGFTDLVAGAIIDKTNSRWGKARPYDIFLPLMWIGTVFLFSVPNFGTTGKAIYIFIMYALVNSVCNTFLMAADPVFLGRTIRSEDNRMSLTSFQGAFIMIFSILANMLIPQMIKGIGSEKSGWTIIALIFAVPLSIIGSIRMLTVKEILTEDHEVKEDSLPLKKTVVLIGKNKMAIILCVMTILTNTITAMNSAVQSYYFKWIFGDVGLASLISLPTFLTPVLLIFAPKIAKKKGTGFLLKLGLVCSVIGYAFRWIFGANLVTIMVGTIFITIGTVPISMLLSIYTLQCIDYGQRKTGERVEGIVSALMGFGTKVGSGVGSALLGGLMGVSGYIASKAATSQPAAALDMIRFLFGGMPLILAAVILILSFFFVKAGKEV
ncbi:MAG: MFS transporter [Bilifractor sp.]